MASQHAKWALPDPVRRRTGFDAFQSTVDGEGTLIRVWRGDRSFEVRVPKKVVEEEDIWAYIAAHEPTPPDTTDDLQDPSPL